MSKSYNNIIPLLGSEKDLKKSVMRIVTNSQEPEKGKNGKTMSYSRYMQHLLTKAVLRR